MAPVKVDTFDFGKLEYFSSYVIGRILPEVGIDNKIAKEILSSMKSHFGKKKFVYITEREFDRNVDLSVYKMIDARRMIGIALVSSKREELITTASKEQAAYSGSFGVFNTIESAVSWALSFVEEKEN